MLALFGQVDERLTLAVGVTEQTELLGDLEWSKGTLRFPVDTPPLEALLRRLVELRLAMLDEA